MAKKPTTRRSTSRRTAKPSNGVAGRRVAAAGVLVAPRTFRAMAATRLRVVNAPNVLSFRKKTGVTQVGQIHGFKTVNRPGTGRKTVGASPSLHRINAPRGRY